MLQDEEMIPEICTEEHPLHWHLQYMADIKKGRIKDHYGRIGKDEVDGKIVEEEMDEKWLEIKRVLIQNFEDNNIDFTRSKPNQGKGK